MLNQTKQFSEDQIKLSDILEPVSTELNLLEKKLIEDLSDNNPLLNKIVQYVIQAGGKRLRPAVSFLIAKSLNKGYLSSNHFQLGQAIELIHTATLVHDDILDETETRRNKLTVNKKWDNKTAIIAGDFLLSKSLIKLAAVKNYSVIEIFANIMSEICEGEIQQKLQNYQSISFDQYIEKSKRKTANLFIAGAECAAILTPEIDNLIIKSARDYALNFGIAFQIVDDILNFTSTEDEFGKPVGIDLRDGIVTAPVIFAIEEYEKKGDLTLSKLISQGFQNENDFKSALDLVLKSDGIEKAKDLAGYYADMANKSLAIIEDNQYKHTLKDLASYIIDRKY
ncbi:MAG: solanesyl diphosphate synthase [uncultured bacterium]|nr:MAG: solanesyl diphosphate synthase [uncultured bacterium]HBH17685.1 solanesyl diphosphate synthase [Cyanobacteria bacterium UBA9579]